MPHHDDSGTIGCGPWPGVSCLHGKEWETSLQDAPDVRSVVAARDFELALSWPTFSQWAVSPGANPGGVEFPVIYDAALGVGYWRQSLGPLIVHWTPECTALVVPEVMFRRIQAAGTGRQTLKIPTPAYSDPSIDCDGTGDGLPSLRRYGMPCNLTDRVHVLEVPNDERQMASPTFPAMDIVLNYDSSLLASTETVARRLTGYSRSSSTSPSGRPTAAIPLEPGGWCPQGGRPFPGRCLRHECLWARTAVAQVAWESSPR